jgi:hypothetical protein
LYSALRILQALVRALEARGYGVAINDGKIFFNVLGEPHWVFLKERLRRQIRELTPEEHDRRRDGIEVRPYVFPSGEPHFTWATLPNARVATPSATGLKARYPLESAKCHLRTLRIPASGRFSIQVRPSAVHTAEPGSPRGKASLARLSDRMLRLSDELHALLKR